MEVNEIVVTGNESRYCMVFIPFRLIERLMIEVH